MKIAVKMLLPGLLLLPLLLPLGGCGCGFDCNSENDGEDSPALLTLGFSDSLPEDLKQVVIEVDSITFRRSGVEDVVVDEFTIPALNLVDVPTFKIDLLKYRGTDQLKVITDLELVPGTYDAVSIAILAGGVNQSYVQEVNGDAFKAIRVSSGVRGLPGMQLASGKQTFTVEFGLAQALQYEASSDTYLLTTNGVRIENNRTAATLSGTVDSTLFDSVSPCTQKGTPTKGNRVYLYKGSSLLPENLADVFNSDSTTPIPTNAIAPFAVASMTSSGSPVSWKYTFGFIPAGSYTIAFACNTEADDAVEYNGLTIPLPINQKYEITLSTAQEGVCDLKESASC
jgi:hypothetical protein